MPALGLVCRQAIWARCYHDCMITTANLSQSVLDDVKILWDFHVIDDGPVKADALLVLGSHDMRVADRAAELYISERAAPLIIATGGAGKVTSAEWERPEGEVYAQRMERNGVPKIAILVESKAANTGDNFEFSKELLTITHHIITSGIVVSKPYMARRSMAVGMKKWSEVKWYVRPPQISLLDYPNDEVPLERMINLMVGDLQRLKVYAEKGFQVPVEIPNQVWGAYGRLVKAGFDKFVLKE
jgi:uncharacterized SAM-binding protein YcdF (DUF218 family)